MAVVEDKKEIMCIYEFFKFFQSLQVGTFVYFYPNKVYAIEIGSVF